MLVAKGLDIIKWLTEQNQCTTGWSSWLCGKHSQHEINRLHVGCTCLEESVGLQYTLVVFGE